VTKSKIGFIRYRTNCPYFGMINMFRSHTLIMLSSCAYTLDQTWLQLEKYGLDTSQWKVAKALFPQLGSTDLPRDLRRTSKQPGENLVNQILFLCKSRTTTKITTRDIKAWWADCYQGISHKLYYLSKARCVRRQPNRRQIFGNLA